MKDEEIAFGHHRFGAFAVSVQRCVFDERDAADADFFEVFVTEDRRGLTFYVHLHDDPRFAWFGHLAAFGRKINADDLAEYNSAVDTLFHRIAQPAWRLSRHSILRLERACLDETRAAKKRARA
jgi:hypothetical protein